MVDSSKHQLTNVQHPHWFRAGMELTFNSTREKKISTFAIDVIFNWCMKQNLRSWPKATITEERRGTGGRRRSEVGWRVQVGLFLTKSSRLSAQIRANHAFSRRLCAISRGSRAILATGCPFSRVACVSYGLIAAFRGSLHHREGQWAAKTSVAEARTAHALWICSGKGVGVGDGMRAVNVWCLY